MSIATPSSGGLKGMLQRTGQKAYETGLWARDYGSTASRFLYKWGGNVAFFLATVSMVTILPLILESGREMKMLESERIQVKELKNRGLSDRQLQELGFSDGALHTPSVAMGSSK